MKRSEVKYEVTIGSRQRCSNCPPPVLPEVGDHDDGGGGGGGGDGGDDDVGGDGGGHGLCVHILFVMLKVLRLPVEGPLVWPNALTDNEIRQVSRPGGTHGPVVHTAQKYTRPSSTYGTEVHTAQ